MPEFKKKPIVYFAVFILFAGLLYVIFRPTTLPIANITINQDLRQTEGPEGIMNASLYQLGEFYMIDTSISARPSLISRIKLDTINTSHPQNRDIKINAFFNIDVVADLSEAKIAVIKTEIQKTSLQSLHYNAKGMGVQEIQAPAIALNADTTTKYIITNFVRRQPSQMFFIVSKDVYCDTLEISLEKADTVKGGYILPTSVSKVEVHYSLNNALTITGKQATTFYIPTFFIFDSTQKKFILLNYSQSSVSNSSPKPIKQALLQPPVKETADRAAALAGIYQNKPQSKEIHLALKNTTTQQKLYFTSQGLPPDSLFASITKVEERKMLITLYDTLLNRAKNERVNNNSNNSQYMARKDKSPNPIPEKAVILDEAVKKSNK
jgi:hypothetical protein